ncbi:MAG: DUF4421 domain-containing protein [Alloprevotella sp.]
MLSFKLPQRLCRLSAKVLLLWGWLILPSAMMAQEVGTVETNPVAVTDSAAVAPATAAPVKAKKGNWFMRFVKQFDEYDTTYISPNYYNYTAMLQNTNFSQSFRIKGTNADGVQQSLNVAPTPGFKIGPYFGWRWLFLGYTFDVGHPGQATKTTEFNLSLYSSMIGCDLVWVKNSGDFTIEKVSGFGDNTNHRVKGLKFSGMDTYTSSINLYYVFNHRHFSYPAAFAQSTVQRKSCGSWTLGLEYSKQRIKFDYRRLPSEIITPSVPEGDSPLIDELKIEKIDYYSFSVNAGYAYNWVFARNCLLSLSFAPSLGFKKSRGERLEAQEIWKNIRNFKFDFIGRAGLVWNNTRWFAGASFVTHLYDFQKDNYSVSNNISYLNVYAGFVFNRKRQYR